MKTLITFRISKDVKIALHDVARSQGVTPSLLCSAIVENYLGKKNRGVERSTKPTKATKPKIKHIIRPKHRPTSASVIYVDETRVERNKRVSDYVENTLRSKGILKY